MIRKALLMTVKPGYEAEYAARHQPIWTELKEVLRAHGVRSYSIFAGKEGQLFGYVEVEDEVRWQQIAGTEVCQRWWRFMSDIMLTNSDHSPVAQALPEVFHLD
jgi:L-rhamnose mutarotase